MEIQAIPVVLDILIGLADLFQEEGNKELALELLAFVTHQTKSGQELQERVMALMPKCEAELSPQTAVRRRERGQAKTLEAVVAKLLDDDLP